MTDRESRALDFIAENGGVDGDHHKQWVLDQVVRILAGDGYRRWVWDYQNGEDGPHTFEWDEGTAP